MTSSLRVLKRFFFSSGSLALFLLVGLGSTLSAQNVILHLKGGDQISGLIVSESTNQVVISNSWVQALSVPLSEISKREPVAMAATPTAAAPVAAVKNSPAPAPAVAGKTNAAAKVAAAKPSVAKPAAPKGVWHGQVNVGLDTLFSTKNQQNYFGQFKLTYEQAYKSNPKKFFRNTIQADGEYQETGSQVSANRANISNKSDFDIGEKSYGYLSGGAGFNQINKINSAYQAGTGGGRHLIRSDSFVLNVEGGVDYQSQNRFRAPYLESIYGRLAEDLTWKIIKNLTLTQNMGFLSNLERTTQFHYDFISNLSYGFWENLSLNLTARDSYSTEVAPRVNRNTFELRLTLGVTF